MRSKFVFLLAVVSLVSTSLSIYLLVERQRSFASGLYAGLGDSSRAQIVLSFTGLEILDQANGISVDSYKKILVRNINSGLLSLSSLDSQVTIRPSWWKILVRMNN